MVNPVLNRFDQGLLFDLTANKVILEKLNCLNENEDSEKTTKQEVSQNNPSLNQILTESFKHFNDVKDIYETENNQEMYIEEDIYAKVKNPFIISLDQSYRVNLELTGFQPSRV